MAIKPPPPLKCPAPTPTGGRATLVSKAFSIKSWADSAGGEKVLLYGASGMGKTTLAALAPDPVFIGLDDGGRKLVHPKTGKPLRHITGVETFRDVLDVLSQVSLFESAQTIVVDTVTRLEELCVNHVLETIPASAQGKSATSIESYGYGKGYRHLYDTMGKLLPVCDNLVRRGKHVVLVAQSDNHRVANPESEDYLKEGPRLYNRTPSVANLYVEWADHVARIGYQTLIVEDKKAAGTTDRAVFVNPEVWFYAKSRTIRVDGAISFESPTDDSFWTYLLR